MKKIWFFLALMVLVAIGCRSKKSSSEEDSGNVMSKKEMISFLTDLQLAEARIRSIADPQLTDTLQRKLFFFDLYKKHNITPSDFNASLKYYLKNVDELDDIYDEVIARLMKEQEEMQHKNPGSRKPPVKIKPEKEE